MKIRSGFVSNSSSSSFVMIGIELFEDSVTYKNLEEKFGDLYEANFNGYDFVYDEPNSYLGKMITFSSEYYLEKAVETLTDLNHIADLMSVNLGIPRDEIKLICGEHMC